MYTVAMSVTFSLAVMFFSYFVITNSPLLAGILGFVVFFATNLLMSRIFLKKIQSLFVRVEKDIKADKYDVAIEKLKKGYVYNHWQFYMKEQINSQIGMLYYVKKRFNEAKSYLDRGMVKNWLAQCMRAGIYFMEKDYEKVRAVMDKAVKKNAKEGFVYSLYAYLLVEMGDKAKAVEILNLGHKKLPQDEKVENLMNALRNNKKMKMQTYGPIWMQMHLGKSPDGGKAYQMHLKGQKIKRR